MFAALYFPEVAFWLINRMQPEPAADEGEVVHMADSTTETHDESEEATFLESIGDEAERKFVDAMISARDSELEDISQDMERIKRLLDQNAQSISDREKGVAGPGVSEEKTRTRSRILGQKRTQRIRLEGQYSALLARRQSTEQELRDRWQAQYRDILDIPRILAVSVENKRVVLLTDVLFGKDRAGAWHRIGPYLTSFCAIEPTLDTIRWINLDGPKKANDGPSICWGPPNIFQTGPEGVGTVGCPGDDARRDVTLAAKNRDFVLLAKVVVRYPECPGSQHNRNMQLWPIVPASDVPQWYIDTFGA